MRAESPLLREQQITVEGLAAAALAYAEAGVHAGVLGMIEAAVCGYGPSGARRALEWWADAVLYAQYDPPPAGPVDVVLVDDDGVPVRLDRLDPLERWAADWIAARVALDDAACAALLLTLPDEGVIEHLATAVFMAATAITPRRRTLAAA